MDVDNSGEIDYNEFQTKLSTPCDPCTPVFPLPALLPLLPLPALLPLLPLPALLPLLPLPALLPLLPFLPSCPASEAYLKYT